MPTTYDYKFRTRCTLTANEICTRAKVSRLLGREKSRVFDKT